MEYPYINVSYYFGSVALDLLADEAQGWSEKQMNIFESLSKLDRKLYCPYSKDEEDLS